MEETRLLQGALDEIRRNYQRELQQFQNAQANLGRLHQQSRDAKFNVWLLRKQMTDTEDLYAELRSYMHPGAEFRPSSGQLLRPGRRTKRILTLLENSAPEWWTVRMVVEALVRDYTRAQTRATLDYLASQGYVRKERRAEGASFSSHIAVPHHEEEADPALPQRRPPAGRSGVLGAPAV